MSSASSTFDIVRFFVRVVLRERFEINCFNSAGRTGVVATRTAPRDSSSPITFFFLKGKNGNDKTLLMKLPGKGRELAAKGTSSDYFGCSSSLNPPFCYTLYQIKL